MSVKSEEKRFTSILRTELNREMAHGKTRLWAIVENLIKIASGSSKPSEAIAATQMIAAYLDGKPKETHEILRGNEVTQEQIEAKRKELELALNVNAHQIEHVVETPPASAL